jgi:8-oxo-dGTP pyrophosphatase MutT (NUDIX family)
MSEKILAANESITYSGKIGEVIESEQPNGRVFERYRRPPGTRIIIVSPDNEILVTKEYRQESGRVDLRLPGGKVRDTVDAYHELLLSNQDMTAAAAEAAKKEALEETGLVIDDLELATIANAGSTVEWDLYYFITSTYDAHHDGQQLEHGEDIEVTWVSIDEIKQAIAEQRMDEWRSVGVLLGIVIPSLEIK